MNPPILLDTCAAIWMVEDCLPPHAVELLSTSYAQGESSFVSPVSAWELGLLFSKRRLRSSRTPPEYFRHLTTLRGVRLAALPPEVLLASSFLPGSPPTDPADRILAATAREYGYALMTRDAALLDYAEEGHLRAVGC
jgi:PIN domain nuclease of toxin-antitoxin system